LAYSPCAPYCIWIASSRSLLIQGIHVPEYLLTYWINLSGRFLHGLQAISTLAETTWGAGMPGPLILPQNAFFLIHFNRFPEPACI
jgi:hypothetical protein